MIQSECAARCSRLILAHSRPLLAGWVRSRSWDRKMTSTASQHSQRYGQSLRQQSGNVWTPEHPINHRRLYGRSSWASGIEAQPGEELGEDTRRTRTNRQSGNSPEYQSPRHLLGHDRPRSTKRTSVKRRRLDPAASNPYKKIVPRSSYKERSSLPT
jgi:hypothetical protein